MKLFAALAVASLVTSSVTTPTREDAASFRTKLHAMVAHAEAGSTRPRETTVTEDEVNGYLRYSAGSQLPVGVTEPSVVIAGDRRLQGRAVVDLDSIRQKRGSGGWFDPVSYLTGRLPVTAVGTLQTRDGRGQFTLERAEISGVPIPKSFLQELVTFYSRTPATPEGLDIDAPFTLPAAIRRIDIAPGRATIVQ